MKRFLLSLFVIVLISPLVSNAQINREVECSTKVYFRQSASTLDENYMNNKIALHNFADEVKRFYQDSAARTGSVRIVSSVSPEGAASFNARLAERRAKAIAEWIKDHFDIDVELTYDSLGVDWPTLINLVDTTFGVPYRTEVLTTLRKGEADKATNRDRFNALMKLRNGVPYRWIYSNLFSEMRYAAVRCEFILEATPMLTISKAQRFSADGGRGAISYSKNMSDDVIPVVNTPVEWITPAKSTANELLFVVAPNAMGESRSATITVDYYGKKYEVVITQDAASMVKTVEQTHTVDKVNEVNAISKVSDVAINQDDASVSTFLALKTNLLYDLALVPNIGAEFYLGHNMSLVTNLHFAWWNKDSWAWYWRTYGGDVALRYWFGQASRIKPLTGHHLGIYGQALTYDFELGNKGVLSNKITWIAGVEYGYSLPIARRLNLDFTLGVGYYEGLRDEYLPIDGHFVWQATKRSQYFGPTKAEISLVWLIGNGNYNKDKGGKR